MATKSIPRGDFTPCHLVAACAGATNQFHQDLISCGMGFLSVPKYVM
ncbi:MAG: hypothetical protein Q8M65_00470 [Rhodoglobus sp.]|nr:hypothetical protein [Rhodoglobus sp.]